MGLASQAHSLAVKVAPRFMLNRHVAGEKLRMMKISAKGRDETNKMLSGKFYAAANPGINRPMAPMLNTPEDYRQAYERIVMIRYGRQMEDDVPYVESILADFETYVVGDLRYRPNTGNKQADAVIQEHLEWRFGTCDYANKLEMTSMAKLAMRSKKRDGEIGFVYVDTGDALKLQAIEADRIGNPLIGSNIGPDNYNGIHVNTKSGAPEYYDIWLRLPKLNAYVFEMQVEANNFIHFYDQFRFSQWHGVSALKNGISRAIDVEQIIQYAIQNIKFRSSQLPAIQNEQGRPRLGNGYVAITPNAQGIPQPYQLTVDGVVQNFLKLGEGYVEYPHDFPNANFIEIKEDLQGEVALGMHLPAEFCFRSKAGGVLQRFYIEKAQRTFDEEKRLLRHNLLDPYKNRTLRYDVDAGILNLDAFPGLAGSRDLYKGIWHMGRSVTTDYGHDTDSDIKLIDAGLMSPEEHAADNARDLDEIRQVKRARVLETYEDAIAISKAVNRPVSEILPYLLRVFPNPVLTERAMEQDPNLAGTATQPSIPQPKKPAPAGAGGGFGPGT